eukprot:g1499.t1
MPSSCCGAPFSAAACPTKPWQAVQGPRLEPRRPRHGPPRQPARQRFRYASLVFAVVLFLLALEAQARTHCSNACASAWDGVCDDGSRCPPGSDCADCGPVHVRAELPPKTYAIRHGDTLGKIGEGYGLMGLTLQFWNKIPDPTKLIKEQTIDVTYAQHQARVAERRRDLGLLYKKEVRVARARALEALFGKGVVRALLADLHPNRLVPKHFCARPSVRSLLQKRPLPPVKASESVAAAALQSSYAHDMSAPDNYVWWAPKGCQPSDTVAIVVPFRDRHAQLSVFLARMHPLLREQKLRYRIFIIEQADAGPFNRGALLNIGAAEAMRHAPRDALFGAVEDIVRARAATPQNRQRLCFVFHDVDMLPVSHATPYRCPTGLDPHHLSTTVDTFVYQCPYSEIMGGVTTFTPEQLIATNGYANDYVEWGGEDDDMSFRVRYAAGRRILRPADCLSRKGACIFDPACQDQVGMIEGYESFDYAATKRRSSASSPHTDVHHPGSYNMNGGKTNSDKHSSADVYRAIFDSPTEYIRSGLSNMQYDRVSVEHNSLYSLVKVRLPPVPEK